MANAISRALDRRSFAERQAASIRKFADRLATQASTFAADQVRAMTRTKPADDVVADSPAERPSRRGLVMPVVVVGLIAAVVAILTMTFAGAGGAARRAAGREQLSRQAGRLRGVADRLRARMSKAESELEEATPAAGLALVEPETESNAA